ncbi:MAG: hypothetical protein K5762_05635 [Bacilli bacterium]|nr:hypothetical protein [Bacilli bacterium]
MNKKLLFLLSFSLLASSCGQESSVIDSSTQEAGWTIPLFHYDLNHIESETGKDYMPFEIDSKTFGYWLNQKASFPLFVYASFCGGCDVFALHIKDYIRQENLSLPFMTLSSYQKTENPLSLSDSAFLFFHEGNLMTYKSNFDDIGSTKELKQYIDQYTYDSQVTILNASYRLNTYDDTFTTYSYRGNISKYEDTDQAITGFEGSYMLVKNVHQLDYPSFYTYLKKSNFDHIVFGGVDLDDKTAPYSDENIVGVYVQP